jgi:hypothetical protein
MCYTGARNTRVSVLRGACTWTGNAMTSGRCLIPRVSTNSRFLLGRRCPLPTRFQAERSFKKDQTFLLSLTCLRCNLTLRNGSTPARASSSHARTSFSAYFPVFSGQRSRVPGTAMSRTTKSSHPSLIMRRMIALPKWALDYLYYSNATSTPLHEIRTLRLLGSADKLTRPVAQRSTWTADRGLDAAGRPPLIPLALV